MPLQAAATLSEGAPEDAFEADAINLSRGGMLLRSQCLPDLGARLRCCFEHPETGAVIEAEGEVVWAQLEGDRSGEIGLAFTSLDARTEMLIEQIIAEHGTPLDLGGDDAPAIDAEPLRAQSSPHEMVTSVGESEREQLDAVLSAQAAPEPRPSAPQRRSKEPSARVTNLSLEGISEPLEAHVAELKGDRAVFEQVLPLLQLGRACSTDAPELAGRRGAIASVELRMIGHVPTLAVTVAFDGAGHAPHEAEFQFTSTDVPAGLSGESDSHDTEPDLSAPGEVDSPQPTHAPIEHRTAYEFSPSHQEPAPRKLVSRAPEPRQLALDALQTPPRVEPRHAKPPQPLEEPIPAALASQVGAQPSAARVSSAADMESPRRPSITEPTTVFSLEDDLEDEALKLREPGWKPLVVQTLRMLQKIGSGGARGAWKLAVAGKTAALPHLRLAFVRLRSLSRHAGRGVGPQLGAMRRLIASQISKKPRRTTAGGGSERAASSEAQGSLGRMLMIGVFTTLAAGLGVYALIPTSEPETALHRPVDVGAEEVPAAPDMTFAPSETTPVVASAPAQAAAPTAAMPSATSVPKESPFAVDVREGARPAAAPRPVAAPAPAAAPSAASAPSKPAPRGMRFGAATAPSRAQRFELRMSKPIAGIEGIADAGGFTVIVNGALSIDRAGPISAAHRGVARAMVLNKGDRAELTIRFADGKRPAYQVRADGSTLYLVIEDV